MSNKIVESYGLINSHLKQTPLELHERLSKHYECEIYLKREDQQLTRSFKIRGALNKISKLTEEEKKKGIVCASAGNHAQGVALAAKIFNVPCHIFLPKITPLQKIKQIEYYSNDNCEILVDGDFFSKTLEIALKFTEENNKVFVHPFNDIDVIYGQGTIGFEIGAQMTPDIILCPIGGGGLVSGIATYFSNQCVQVMGVEPKNSASMKEAIDKGKIVSLENSDNFVDGASVKRVGDVTFEICKKELSDVLIVDNNRLCFDMIDLYQKDGIVTEPAGALSVSGLTEIKDKIKGKKVVCIISGGNNDVTRYPEIMEKSLQYQNLLHYYLVEFNQTPGELKKFINNIISDKDDIIRFEYIKKTNKYKGNVLIGIQVDEPTNVNEINSKLNYFNFKFQEIKRNDLLYDYLI